jgi:hypothetical protein
MKIYRTTGGISPLILNLGKPPGTHSIGGLVVPRAGLGVLEKRKISCPFRHVDIGASSLVTIPTTVFRLPL